MKTILCYAFVVQPTHSVWDLCEVIAAAEIDYLHDCTTGQVFVRMDDAVKADDAIRAAGLEATGRMESLPEADWLSDAALELPLCPTDIDWDIHEEWSAGPRFAIRL